LSKASRRACRGGNSARACASSRQSSVPPPEVVKWVESTTEVAELEKIQDRALAAATMDEMGMP